MLNALPPPTALVGAGLGATFFVLGAAEAVVCCLEVLISNALVGLMAFSSPNSSVDQMGALTVHVDGKELGI